MFSVYQVVYTQQDIIQCQCQFYRGVKVYTCTPVYISVNTLLFAIQYYIVALFVQ